MRTAISTLFAAAFLLTMLWPSAVWSAGAIPFQAGVQVSHSRQVALIAYDGVTEIMIVSTDLKASRPTKVLEVIPFPSEPKVTAGKLDRIDEANQHVYDTLGGRTQTRGVRVARAAVGQLTFRKKIGAHDISVVRAVDAEKFASWVETFLRSQGVDKPIIPTMLKNVVDEYLRDGCEWFAFDVIDLGTDEVTRDAIEYQFKTTYLYYPLRINRTDRTFTSIRLLLVSPNLVNIPQLGGPRAILLHDPVDVPRKTIEYWHKDMAAMFDPDADVLLRAWDIKGRPATFRRDVATTWFR